ncbi:MAG: glycosyltransferase family A protein [Cytophagales bacterium]|nr:glycosyltransferase family A protein [Cytophagales bacterium]
MAAARDCACTVIIPCYNAGIRLARAVSSVREQTYPFVSLLVIDDASEDPITRDYLKTLPSHEKLCLSQNRGPSVARNQGIQQIKTPFLALLDADDEYEPDYLTQTLKELLRSPKIGAAGSYLLFYKEGETKASRRWKPRGGDLHDFFFLTQSAGCLSIRRELWEKLGGHDESMKTGMEDWEFFIRLTQAGYHIAVSPKYLYKRYLYPDSLMARCLSQYQKQSLNYLFQKHQNLYMETPPLRPLLSLFREILKNPKLLFRLPPMLRMVHKEVYQRTHPQLYFLLKLFFRILRST